ncbi:MAG TPA: ABC transporter permease [Candidatus Krumholzibacteria bacterium]|nr:ABC transporter permease [Candidatus Krumholzibacteria bacterium]
MSVVHRLYHLARADFFERVRRHGFLITMLFCVYAGYAFLPPNPSPYATLKLDQYRGVYNSAWVGTAVAMLSAVFISMIGFYVVKNAIQRDRHTRVGQILATTPISRVQYTLGKTISNFAVLAAMALVVAIACIGMQVLRAEDRSIDLVRLLAPFVLLTLPMLFVTAALAVLFETLPLMRGGFGNVAYFFLFGAFLAAGAGNESRVSSNEVTGMGIAIPSMIEAAHAAYPEFEPDSVSVSMGINIRSEGEWSLKTFEWNGIDWTLQSIGWRMSWVLVGLVVGAAAAIPFDRFDPARGRGDSIRAASRRWGRRRRATAREVVDDAEVEATPSHANVHLTPLPAGARGIRLGAMVMAEWKLVVRGLRWWYAGPIAALIASIFAPLSGVQAIVLPLAWFWPVLQWSKLGTREARFGTGAIFFSTPHPLARQLFATWIAGVMLAVLAAAPVAVRFAIAGESASLAAWCVGAAFIPALALALGVWTGSGKFFEVLYTALCYAVVQHVPPMDFMGAIPEATEKGYPTVYAGVTLVLLAIALLGRRRQVRG